MYACVCVCVCVYACVYMCVAHSFSLQFLTINTYMYIPCMHIPTITIQLSIAFDADA